MTAALNAVPASTVSTNAVPANAASTVPVSTEPILNDDHRSRCAALGDQLRADLTRAGISSRLLAHFGDNNSTTASLLVAGGVVTITATAEQTIYRHAGVDEHVGVIIDSVLTDAVLGS